LQFLQCIAPASNGVAAWDMLHGIAIACAEMYDLICKVLNVGLSLQIRLHCLYGVHHCSVTAARPEFNAQRHCW
jgi:hypothetical protein